MASIQDVLSKKGAEVFSVKPEALVAEAAKMMSRCKVGALLVMRGTTCLGLFTERDLMNRVIAEEKDPKTTKVEDVMTSQVAVGRADMDINEAGALMSQNRLRHLPIAEGKKIIGMISAGDLLAWKIKENEQTVRHLEDYFFGMGR